MLVFSGLIFDIVPVVLSFDSPWIFWTVIVEIKLKLCRYSPKREDTSLFGKCFGFLHMFLFWRI